MTEAEKIFALLHTSIKYSKGELTYEEVCTKLKELGEEDAIKNIEVLETVYGEKSLLMATYILQNLNRFPELEAGLLKLE